jgi:hypothetical protein
MGLSLLSLSESSILQCKEFGDLFIFLQRITNELECEKVIAHAWTIKITNSKLTHLRTRYLEIVRKEREQEQKRIATKTQMLLQQQQQQQQIRTPSPEIADLHLTSSPITRPLQPHTIISPANTNNNEINTNNNNNTATVNNLIQDKNSPEHFSAFELFSDEEDEEVNVSELEVAVTIKYLPPKSQTN